MRVVQCRSLRALLRAYMPPPPPSLPPPTCPQVDFLKRVELREYETERDQRLASDIRTRGRL